MERTVNHILDKESGKYFTAKELLGNSKISQFQLRYDMEKRIQKDIAKYVCLICGQKIKLRAGEKNIFHFAHLKDSDDCPIKTDTKFTEKQLLAMMYNGAKESEKHIKMKKMLYEILELDERFHDVKMEKVIKGIKDKISWRKPDVHCIHNDQKHIFEIQLSHTFLKVIVARELFYEMNEMPLFWIFDEFTPEPNYIKIFQGDIFAHHNCNLMVLDSDTYNFSIENKKLHLNIFWIEPYIENNKEIKHIWKNERVDFEKIIFDNKTNRAYYFDYELKLTEQQNRLKKIKEYHKKREMIFNIIRKDENYSKSIRQFQEKLNELDDFAEHKLGKWDDNNDVYKLYDLFRLFLSLREKEIMVIKKQILYGC
jgi:competence CoiA-like predicted nuclease